MRINITLVRASLMVVAFAACAATPKPLGPQSGGAAGDHSGETSANRHADLGPADPNAGDLDRDGIPDGADMCPREAEDLDGFEDENGCPETDNDRDRILDANDLCPNDPEVYNGVEDGDGCPDEGRVITFICRLSIEDKIKFSKNTSALPSEAGAVLDQIVRTMNGNPQIPWFEVQGHAAPDERGPQRLARARASVVIEYLVAHGVEPGRLKLGAYGADRPAGAAGSQSVLAKSRRVEFSMGQPGTSRPDAP